MKYGTEFGISEKIPAMQILRGPFCICVFNAFLFMHSGHAQNPLEPEKEVFANAADAEKIYLQLSSSTFNTAETVWFKAVVTDVLHHRPTRRSKVLHVELIDPINDQIIDKSLLKIENGISDGFFQLHSSYREGKYIIRAYTEWNKNFGADFISSVPVRIFGLQTEDKKSTPIKDIELTRNSDSDTFTISSTISLKELDSLHTGDATVIIEWRDGRDSVVLKSNKDKQNIGIQHRVPSNASVVQYHLKTKNKEFTKSVVLDEDYGTLQFFPEGGSLVAGLQSVIGFKYLDYRGRGNEIQGIIVDQNDNKVAAFKSNKLGMGRLILIPEAGNTYYGVLTKETGTTYKYELPKAKSNGLVLNVIEKNTNKELRIWNKEKNYDSLFVKLHFRGKNLFFLKGRFKKGVFLYSFPSKSLPQGVIGLTVYDKYYKPVAERHFFNKRKEENLNIAIETDKSRYTIRDSVQVSISAEFQGQPKPASISVMAVDSAYYYSTNPERNSIVSYFLLQSDIRGSIEDPSYYFENDKNLAELDYLMLTQGWTNYKYKEARKPRTFQAEKGLEVSGVIEGIRQRSQTNGIGGNGFQVNMLLMGKSPEAYSQTIDSTGNFRFSLRDSYGAGRSFVLQPADTKSLSDGLKININKHQPPEVSFDREKVLVPVDSIIEENISAKIEEDIKRDPFLYANAISLNEVVVSDYRVTPERAKMVELHGMPDALVENKELMSKQKNWTRNLYSWLLFNYRNELRIERVESEFGGFEIARVHGADFTYVVIDGYPVRRDDYRLIGNIPVDAVKSVEIIRNAQTANKYFSEVFMCAPACPPPPFPAILAIYTFSGKGLMGSFPGGKGTNLKYDTAPQFSPIREFYNPEYQVTENIDWNIPDRRTLLYWKPNIATNNITGKANSTFFNSDLKGKMVIICEGITADGKVGYSNLTYEVKNP